MNEQLPNQLEGHMPSDVTSTGWVPRVRVTGHVDEPPGYTDVYTHVELPIECLDDVAGTVYAVTIDGVEKASFSTETPTRSTNHSCHVHTLQLPERITCVVAGTDIRVTRRILGIGRRFNQRIERLDMSGLYIDGHRDEWSGVVWAGEVVQDLVRAIWKRCRRAQFQTWQLQVLQLRMNLSLRRLGWILNNGPQIMECPDIPGVRPLRWDCSVMGGIDARLHHNWRIKGDLNLSSGGHITLFESLGALSVSGDVLIVGDPSPLETWRRAPEFTYPYTRTLPDSFGGMDVGRDLIITDNNLQTLPESFGSLVVGGKLILWLHRSGMEGSNEGPVGGGSIVLPHTDIDIKAGALKML